APAAPVAPGRVTAWSSEQATASLRAALDRRGLTPDVVDGPMLAERFLPLGPPGLADRAPPLECVCGAWVVASAAGAWWGWSTGQVEPADGLARDVDQRLCDQGRLILCEHGQSG